jgi:tetratricopeptide (TPR) repeat protein
MIKDDRFREIENTLELVKEEVNKNIFDGDLEEAKEKVNKQLRRLVGLDMGTVDVFSFESIAGLISKEMQYNAEKFIAFGSLMKLRGLISHKENNQNTKIQYYEKSLEGFYKAYTEDDELTAKYLGDAAEVASELSNYELSLDVDRKILKIYELSKNLDKAEDTLFYMLRKTDNDGSIILEGMRFYNRLKEIEPNELKQGNLPLEEVEDGIIELERRLGL